MHVCKGLDVCTYVCPPLGNVCMQGGSIMGTKQSHRIIYGVFHKKSLFYLKAEGNLFASQCCHPNIQNGNNIY